MTGAGLEALNAAGCTTPKRRRGRSNTCTKPSSPTAASRKPGHETESNVGSTAWVVQGIWAAGGNPETWITAGGTEPLGYMASLQQPDGHIRWT